MFKWTISQKQCYSIMLNNTYVTSVFMNYNLDDNQSCYLFQTKVTGTKPFLMASLYCIFNVMMFLYHFVFSLHTEVACCRDDLVDSLPACCLAGFSFSLHVYVHVCFISPYKFNKSRLYFEKKASLFPSCVIVGSIWGQVMMRFTWSPQHHYTFRQNTGCYTVGLSGDDDVLWTQTSCFLFPLYAKLKWTAVLVLALL